MLILRIIFLLILAFPAVTYADKQLISTNQTNTPPPQTDEKAHHSNKGDNLTSSYMPSLKKNITNLKTTNTQQKHDNWLKNPFNNIKITDIIVAIFTIIIGIFTWRLSVSTKKLWLANIKQGKDNLRTIEASERSARAAETAIMIAQKSADAAEKSFYVAKETANVMRAQDRAYLFVNVKLYKNNKGSDEIAKIRENGVTGENLVHVTIINRGKTPAIIKSFRSKVDFYTTKGVADYFTNYWMTKSIVAPEFDIIESGKDITYTVSFYIGPDEEHYFTNSNNSAMLLCLGIVEYEDVFNNPHNTIFCWEFSALIADFYICEKYIYNQRT